MELDRMAAMLIRLGGRGYQVREDQTVSGDEMHDFDPDFDSDLDQDAKEPQSNLAGNPQQRAWMQRLERGLFHLFLKPS